MARPAAQARQRADGASSKAVYFGAWLGPIRGQSVAREAFKRFCTTIESEQIDDGSWSSCARDQAADGRPLR